MDRLINSASIFFHMQLKWYFFKYIYLRPYGYRLVVPSRQPQIVVPPKVEWPLQLGVVAVGVVAELGLHLLRKENKSREFIISKQSLKILSNIAGTWAWTWNSRLPISIFNLLSEAWNISKNRLCVYLFAVLCLILVHLHILFVISQGCHGLLLSKAWSLYYSKVACT